MLTLVERLILVVLNLKSIFGLSCISRSIVQNKNEKHYRYRVKREKMQKQLVTVFGFSKFLMLGVETPTQNVFRCDDLPSVGHCLYIFNLHAGQLQQVQTA